MKIIIENGPATGVPLQSVPFGSVVRLTTMSARDPCYYIVVSTMDGTGRRALVSLRSGCLRGHDYERYKQVVVVNATLTVHGDLPDEPKRTCPVCFGTNGKHEAGCYLGKP